MIDFDSILNAAQQLPAEERLRLIQALWDSVPPDADIPLHEDWAPELERRVAALESGAAKTVAWSQIRNDALARIGHGNVH
jgi:putative addiction module component (TIGR02574 family)